jgi:hypothetical protein
VNNKGIIQIQKNKMEEWNTRLENLKNQIEYWCKEENQINKTIEIIQLYFDAGGVIGEPIGSLQK